MSDTRHDVAQLLGGVILFHDFFTRIMNRTDQKLFVNLTETQRKRVGKTARGLAPVRLRPPPPRSSPLLWPHALAWLEACVCECLDRGRRCGSKQPGLIIST